MVPIRKVIVIAMVIANGGRFSKNFLQNPICPSSFLHPLKPLLEPRGFNTVITACVKSEEWRHALDFLEAATESLCSLTGLLSGLFGAAL